MTRATPAAVTDSVSKATRPANRCNDNGTVTIASSDVVTMRLNTNEGLPPSLMSFFGTNGAPAHIAKTTSASSVLGGSASTRTITIATTGITTYIATTDRSSSAGRCQR